MELKSNTVTANDGREECKLHSYLCILIYVGYRSVHASYSWSLELYYFKHDEEVHLGRTLSYN